MCQCAYLHLSLYTHIVNREIFVVKIFSDSMASAKIKRTKIMHIINNKAIRGRLSENYLTRKFITQNICDTKYLQFTVSLCSIYTVKRITQKFNIPYYVTVSMDGYYMYSMCVLIVVLNVQ